MTILDKTIVEWTLLPEPPRFVVVDTEVAMFKRGGEWSSLPYKVSPPAPTPYILALGCATQHDPVTTVRYTDVHFNFRLDAVAHCENGVIVGHNLGYDYQQFRGTGRLVRWQLVWDTMIADYILSGQRNKFASLGDLMNQELKILPKADLIGDMLKLDKPPQDIPKHDLDAYLQGDLTATRNIFLSQWTRATVAQRRLIIVQTRASLVYADCSYNGLLLDTPESVTRRDRCFKTVERMTNGFAEVWTAGNADKADDIVAMTAKDDESWAVTPTAMSALFFGRPEKLNIGAVPDPTKGKRRVRQVMLDRPNLGGSCPAEPEATQASKPNGVRSTADAVLQAIRDSKVEPYASLAAMEQKRRESHKLGTTYYQALLEQQDIFAGRIHPTINATATNTGRTSASNPNIQNQPPETREVFLPDDGSVLHEFDFEQLEMCALAQVSGCEALQASLRAGVDIHYMTGRTAGMWRNMAEMTKEKRTLVKRVNFGLVYGGGAKTLAAQSGVDVPVVRTIIDSFYKTFPGVREYHERLAGWVKGDLIKPPGFFTDRNVIITLGENGTTNEIEATSKTGRVYVFPEEPAPEWLRKRGTERTVSPTKVKNYPIQGFGTGDIVPLVLSNLWEMLPSIYWRAVVHDSGLLNVPLGTDPRPVVAEAVDRAVAQLKAFWDIDMRIPLRTSHETKTRWSPRKED